MNGKPIEVPTVDQLIADPGRVFQLPPDVARMLLSGVSALIPALISQSSRESGKAETPSLPERNLTTEEAAARFNVPKRWLRDNKHRLPHIKISHKKLLWPELRLAKWFGGQKGN